VSPPWEVLGVGAAAGGVVGIYVGYQTHKIVLRVQDWRQRRAFAKLDAAKLADERRRELPAARLAPPRERRPPSEPGTKIVRPFRKVMTKPQLTPIVDTTRGEREPISANPWRDDVIAALTGAGYSRKEAIRWTDACSTDSRIDLETWVTAALTGAVAGDT
jgi:hypothetical protein